MDCTVEEDEEKCRAQLVLDKDNLKNDFANQFVNEVAFLHIARIKIFV